MKTRHIFSLILAALVLNGCSKDGQMPLQPECTNPETDPHAIAAVVGEPTRTTMDIAHNILWCAGDRIRLFGASVPGGAVYTTASDNTRTGIFLPEDAAKSVNDEIRYAVYPAAAAEGATLSGSELRLDLSALAVQPYNAALGAGADVAAVPMVAVSNDKSFTFRNICGGIRLQLVDYQDLGLKIRTVEVTAAAGEQIAGEVTVDLATAQPTLAAGAVQTVTIDCGEGAGIASGGDLTKGGGFVVFLPAGRYAGFRFAVTDTDGRRYETETRQPVTVEAGVVTPLSPLPLTLYYGTANCYRTAGSGTVEIDATPYYTFSEEYVHEGRKCVDAAGRTAGAPAKAQIVWQQPAAGESGDVVESPTLDGTTLRVTATGRKGNAVVAVCAADGTILWSYHVWASEAEDVVWKNGELGTFRMLDRNIGATSTVQKDRNAYGLFYQWGRKDPFAQNLTAERPSGKPYESASSDLVRTEAATAETGTIAYALRHPDTRLLSADDWHVAGRNNALWGNAAGTVEAGRGVKTVYDPCPAGYRVPELLVYAGLTDKDKSNCNAQYGHMFDVDGAGTTSYFATSGYLNKNAHKTMYLEYRGYLWANVAGEKNAYRFYLNNADVNWSKEMERASGIPVRCVKMK